jgi:hypothetical protein
VLYDTHVSGHAWISLVLHNYALDHREKRETKSKDSHNANIVIPSLMNGICARYASYHVVNDTLMLCTAFPHSRHAAPVRSIVKRILF